MPTKLPGHLFISSCDGALHDTRMENWASIPIRREYYRTSERINTVSELKATLRAGRFTSVGFYPLYFITSDGAALSFQSVRDNLADVMLAIRDNRNDGWRVTCCAVNWEDTDLIDDHSGELIESAYGE